MSGEATADLTAALLARKGTADATGFADAPATEPVRLVPRSPAAEADTAARILIVEDDALNMKMMTDLFEARGFRAVPAVNGAQALASARIERPDLVVMDIDLPDLSGLEVTRRLRDDPGLAAVPVIAVSAVAGKDTVTLARDAGCDAYIAKPASVDCLLETVAALLP